jgi:iron complex transport system ATP-binding protein
MAPILSLAGVCFRYDSATVVDDVSLRVERGEVLGILGPNGSGKSTLLSLMDGILSPNTGEVLVDGVPIETIARTRIARQIAMVSQEHHFRFDFSVLQVALMGRYPHLGRLQFEGGKDMAVVRDALQATACLELAERSIHELSGGERQRVLIARALAQEPKVILLDEPTSFLDLKFKREIFQLVERLSVDKKLGVVVVSHDIDLVARYCTQVVLLKDGSILEIGVPGDVITARNVEAVFECPVRVDENPVTGRPRVSIL